jgi:hypothetical protein
MKVTAVVSVLLVACWASTFAPNSVPVRQVSSIRFQVSLVR